MVVRAHAAEALEVDVPDAGAFISIETPADYERHIGRLPEIPRKEPAGSATLVHADGSLIQYAAGGLT